MVTKHEGTFIVPGKPTPSHTLSFSTIDRVFPPGFFVKRLLVFKQGSDDVHEVIRLALAKALVPYYPLAGRIVRSDSGNMEVACTGDGAWFVEASAECSLQDVEWFTEMPLKIPKEDLMSYPSDAIGVPLLLQVTRFRCGGFVIFFVYNHAIADGVGMAQFLNAVAEMARGLETPLVEPILSTDESESALSPPLPPVAFIGHASGLCEEYFHVDISLDHIKKLKDQFRQETGKTYSTFEILGAKLWQCRAKVISVDHDDDLCLTVFTDVRSHLLSQCGGGYYRNCVFPLAVMIPYEKLVSGSIVEVMNLIREEKERLAIKVSKWSKGEERPLKLRLGYHHIFMAVWTSLGFDEVDFGWGKPCYVAPVLDTISGGVAFLVRSPAPMEGVRLITKFVVEEELDKFQDEIMEFLDSSSA